MVSALGRAFRSTKSPVVSATRLNEWPHPRARARSALRTIRRRLSTDSGLWIRAARKRTFPAQLDSCVTRLTPSLPLASPYESTRVKRGYPFQLLWHVILDHPVDEGGERSPGAPRFSTSRAVRNRSNAKKPYGQSLPLSRRPPAPACSSSIAASHRLWSLPATIPNICSPGWTNSTRPSEQP